MVALVLLGIIEVLAFAQLCAQILPCEPRLGRWFSVARDDGKARQVNDKECALQLIPA